MAKKKALLVILDGWGIAKDPERSAIDQADTPFIDSLIEDYPNATLVTYGEEVGLPEGQMGNSEVGHLNLGAGRVVYQAFARINKAIRNNQFEKNETLVELLNSASERKANVHLMGLVSDGGVHSHINHLKALCDITQSYDLENVFIHAFMDGRDCDPKSGLGHIDTVLKHIDSQSNIRLGSLIGRYYAMDRDNRWERINKAYDLLINGKADIKTSKPLEAIKKAYDDDLTDEFMPSILVNKNSNIKNGDTVIFFNFRTDRPRQITTALTQKDFPEHDMEKLDLSFATMTQYDESFKNISVLYKKNNLKNTIGEVLQNAGKSQVRIAETEKYPHVTFFFSGGREAPFDREKRLLVPSPKVETYDLAPEMGAKEITDQIIEEVENNRPDFICLNYANADMIGHTGDLIAAIKACVTIDEQLKRLVSATKDDYEIYIIADHGNSDIIVNKDGSPHTAHTTNLVPLILITSDNDTQIVNGKLGDLAPTILKRMGVAIPEDMDGHNLVL